MCTDFCYRERRLRKSKVFHSVNLLIQSCSTHQCTARSQSCCSRSNPHTGVANAPFRRGCTRLLLQKKEAVENEYGCSTQSFYSYEHVLTLTRSHTCAPVAQNHVFAQRGFANSPFCRGCTRLLLQKKDEVENE